MQTLNTLFDAKLREAIEAEIDQSATNLANGVAPDYAEYRRHIGRIQGLKRALELCETVQSDLSKS